MLPCRRYLGLKGKPAVTEPGVIDNPEALLDTLGDVSPQEQRVVLQVYLLTASLAGQSVPLGTLLYGEKGY